MSIVRVPVRMDFTQPGGPGYNVWHIRTADDNPETWELSGALDALEDFYQANAGLYHAGTTITIGEGMVRDPLGSPTYVDDDVRTLTGGNGSAPGSTMLAVVVSWRTTSATRSGRGRTFLGPITSAVVSGDGTPSNLFITQARAAATALVAASTAANGWAIGVLSTKQGIFRDAVGSSVRDRYSFLSSRRD